MTIPLVVGSKTKWGTLSPVQGKAQNDVAVLDAFPYVASLAVANQRGVGGQPDKVFAGAGGGILPLESAAPSWGLTEASFPPRLDTRGMVLDVALSPQHAFVAALHVGLVVYDRTTYAGGAVWDTEGAWCVAQANLGNQRTLIAVGTQPANNYKLGGRLLLFVLDRSKPLSASNPAFVAEPSLGATPAPVWTVAVATTLPLPPGYQQQVPAGATTFTVLVGLERSIDNPGASLQRLDFWHEASLGTSQIASALAWNGHAQGNKVFGRLIRKLVVEESSRRVYAAAYWDGVYAFDVDATLAPIGPNAAWPIRAAQLSYSNAIAFDPSPEAGVAARLIVGWGKNLAAESQYIGASQNSPNLDAPAVANGGVEGLALFKLANFNPTTAAVLEHHRATITPRAIAVRKADPTTLLVDVAADTDGFFAWRATQASVGAPFRFDPAPVGSWAGGPPPKLPLHAMDDLVIGGDAAARTLYVATETSVSTFDVTAPNAPLLSSYRDHASPPGAYLLTLIPGPDLRLIATTAKGNPNSPGGLAFYAQVAGHLEGVKASDGQNHQLNRAGFGYGVLVINGVHDASKTPSARRYLYSIQTFKITTSTPVTPTWAIRSWDIGADGAPRDPQIPPPLTSTLPNPAACSSGDQAALGGPTCVASFLTSSDPETANAQVEGLLVLQDVGAPQTTHVVYALFAPHVGVGSAGLIVLRTHPPSAAMTYEGSIDVWSNVGQGVVGVRLSYDAAAKRIYAAWATGGIAVFDVSASVQAPTLVARRAAAQFAAPGSPSVPVQVVAGPVGASGRRYLYVALLNQGIAVCYTQPSVSGPDPEDLILWRGPYRMRFQTTALAIDPSDPTRRTIYTTQARGGVDRVRFDPKVFP